ncbi:glycosyltransferase [Haloarcula sp. JP-L23]|uniref:glycosyltransferase n=1 Tax=Haloarcula sp. JP-L23 TaxID=2716717 RepID=UPI00140EF3EA|nr:beta-1,4-galactosyltransferase [Haloarcula sp. JP-L23]
MMFATVGTRPDGFDRLIRQIDSIAVDFDEPIRAQIGAGEYVPEDIDWFRFTSEEEIHELYRTATVVIAHAGAGTLLTALSYGKPIVVLPRREQHGDHNDDHQTELANALSERAEVFVVHETSELRRAMRDARSISVESGSENNSLVRFLNDYIEDIDT